MSWVFFQNNNKRIDDLIAEIFKHSFQNISQFLLKLFNRLFSIGEYPKSWGEGIIVLIFKGRNIEDPKNYRGVTLINVLAKIYSQVLLIVSVNGRLNTKFYSKSVSKKKVYSRLYILLHAIITKTIGSRKKLYCLFLEYENALTKSIQH